MLSLFVKGLIIGLAIAAPVGPIGVLCIQRSLRDGFKIGFMTGMGAATADGVIAAFGNDPNFRQQIKPGWGGCGTVI